MPRPRCAGASRVGQLFTASAASTVLLGPPACARRSSAPPRPESGRGSARAAERSPAQSLKIFWTPVPTVDRRPCARSEEHTSELQSLMRISYDVFCLKKKKQYIQES